MSEAQKFKVDDLVLTKYKNRLGLDCAATITSYRDGLYTAQVWNMYGPGADITVTGIPESELRECKQ